MPPGNNSSILCWYWRIITQSPWAQARLWCIFVNFAYLACYCPTQLLLLHVAPVCAVPSGHKQEQLTDADRYYLTNEYKREVVSAMSTSQLIEICLINPTVTLLPSYRSVQGGGWPLALGHSLISRFFNQPKQSQQHNSGKSRPCCADQLNSSARWGALYVR